ncbi:hypothetical protein V5P93_002738 [Actinokineospora auranticolor]|uniref:Uncharacterized protein n=1 Tax=Actinokineospora auranticolor TaxID=155976 RepID=A0A2S6H0C8_9PSEU|nr:hypothetical protein [Actinokineospora auranticolor]PPK70876.1 hypothetical protein CLV40_10162 [Actinokineospora auranticolor]
MLRRCYRLAWLALAAAVAILGVGTGAVLLRSWTLLFLGVTAGCLAMATAAARTDPDSARPDRGTALLTLLFCAALVGVAGLVMLVEWVAFAVVGALAAAAYPLFGLRAMSTSRLCERWRTGLDTLRAAQTPLAAAAVVRERQKCLDELERRDPIGFARWLETPGADPATILRPRQGTR